MWVLIQAIGGFFARFLTVQGAKFIGTKALIYSFGTLIIPVILYNVFTRILDELLQYASIQISAGGVQPALIQLSGMAGWIAQNAQIPLCFTMILSAVSLRFMLSMVRI